MKHRRDYDDYINKCEELEEKKRSLLNRRYNKKDILDNIITSYSRYTMIDTINLGDYIYISLGKWKKCIIYVILDSIGIEIKLSSVDNKQLIPKSSSGIYISKK
jgi:hypothetical protein